MKSILIVEDSSTTRAMIRAVAEEVGEYAIVEASSGFEALRLLPSQIFDLILTDINMPDINGLELINFVKNNPAYREVPLVIISTERSEEDRKRGLALGAVDYVTKPFKPEELQAVIRRTLEDG